MRMKKIGSVFEITLIILSVFAISFLISEALGPLELVSAQESGGLPGSSGDTQTQIADLEVFREEFPQLSDGRIRRLINEFESVEDARKALDELEADSNNAFDLGLISDNLLKFMNFFGNVIPDFESFGGSNFLQDLFGGNEQRVYVCPLDNRNAVCQNYVSTECADNCQVNCISVDVAKEELPADSECAIGICYEPDEGICQSGANGGGVPRRTCGPELGGEWYEFGDDEVVDLCRVGCCILGDEANLGTQRECEKQAEENGISLDEEDAEFRPDLTNEFACINSARPFIEGACIIPIVGDPEGKNDCRFTNFDECLEITGSAESFYSDTLCSHPELNTNCLKQDTTSCVEGLEEVYWLDSCRNKENIFNSDLDRSWNGGIVLPKEQSCAVGNANDPIANQATCGNCNTLRSTFCGEKIGETDLGPAQEIPEQDFVCRDMGCYDKNFLGGWERQREHGESWCAYNSQIGMAGPDSIGGIGFTSFLPANPLANLLGGEHSTDTPGSRHFRVICQYGERITSACDDNRNAICVETQTPQGVNTDFIDPDSVNNDLQGFFDSLINNPGEILFGGTYSQASCRPNRYAECYNYNPDQDEARLIGMAGESSGKILEAKLDLTCGFDSDCFVKKVDLTDQSGDTFKFGICAPRYPPGSELSTEEGNQVAACNLGTKVCTAVFVKEESGPFGAAVGAVEWVCKSNCDCIEGDEPDSAEASEEFIKEMNELCISLGDCGNHVNYVGQVGGTKGFKVKVASCDVEEERCDEGGGLSDLTGDLGLPGLDIGFGDPSNPHPEDAEAIPGEFIQAEGSFLDEIIGNSQGGFFEGLPGLEELLSGLGDGDFGGLDEIFNIIDGITPGSSTPSTDFGMGLGSSASAGFLGGTATAIRTFSAVRGATGTVASSIANEPVANFVAHANTPASLSGASVTPLPGEITPASIPGLPGSATGANVPAALPAQPIAYELSFGTNQFSTEVVPRTMIIPRADPGFASIQADLANADISPISDLWVGSDGSTIRPIYAPSNIPGGPGSTFAPTGGGAQPLGANGRPVTLPDSATGGAANIVSVTGPQIVGLMGGIVAGALAGAALNFLMDTLGISGGLNPVTSITLTVATSTVAAASATAAIEVAFDKTLELVFDPTGGMILVAVAIYIILSKIQGVGDMRKVEVTFECQSWVPPQGGDCGSCGNDRLSDGSDSFPCSAYSCKALGQNCQFVVDSEVPEDGGLCIVSDDLDNFPPKMIEVNEDIEPEGFDYKNFEFDRGFDLRKRGDSECLDSFERVTFGFNMDESAKCFMSAVPPIGPEGLERMVSLGTRSKNQVIEFSSLDLDNLGLEDGLNEEQRNDITLFVICEDYYEQRNLLPFEINLCVIPRDLTPVLFLGDTPFEDSVRYDAVDYDLNVLVDKPAECRWDPRDNVDFDQMSPSRECTAVEVNGRFNCVLNDIPTLEGSTDVCVKCLTHPEWVGGPRESERKENAQCFDATIRRSPGALEISLISPDDGEIVKTGSLANRVNLEVATSSGAFNGVSVCSYEINGGAKISFESTGDTRHEQLFDRITSGGYHIKVVCEDNVNPAAVLEFDFEVIIDNVLPEVSRIYVEGSSLFIVTNEAAECAYTFSPLEDRDSACGFSIDEANDEDGVILMSIIPGSNGFRHSTGFDDGRTYYIKCKDEFNRGPLGCSIIASGGDFID